ncbi:MAG: YdeI/OmpD-associated family protein [Myxococcota bacterium]
MGSELDRRFETAEKWRDEALFLRGVLLGTGLVEARKWGKPCYSHEGSNIAILQRMNDFLALMFFKGVLLSDPDGLLHAPGPSSHHARRLHVTSLEQARSLEGRVEAWVREAIGVIDVPIEAPEHELCAELVEALEGDDALRTAFEGLTPGRQRAWDLQIGGAKQVATRLARIEKARPSILAGKGPNDR